MIDGFGQNNRKELKWNTGKESVKQNGHSLIPSEIGASVSMLEANGANRECLQDFSDFFWENIRVCRMSVWDLILFCDLKTLLDSKRRSQMDW